MDASFGVEVQSKRLARILVFVWNTVLGGIHEQPPIL